MKLYELIEELREGKHVRRSSWVPGVTAATHGVFGFFKIFRDGEISLDYFTVYEIFEGDDWEVVSQKGKAISLMNFTDAMLELISNDKKIRRSAWMDGVCLSKNKEGAISISKNDRRITYSNVIDNEDIIGKDWEIYEEETLSSRSACLDEMPEKLTRK